MTPADLKSSLKALGWSYPDLAERLNAEAEPGQTRYDATTISRMINGYKTRVGGVLTQRPARVDLGVAAFVRLQLQLAKVAA